MDLTILALIVAVYAAVMALLTTCQTCWAYPRWLRVLMAVGALPMAVLAGIWLWVTFVVESWAAEVRK